MKSIFGTAVLSLAITLIHAQHFDHKSGEYLTRNGTIIYYKETGKKDGPTLLLLHGVFGDIENFNTIIPGLSDNFRIIGIDSRGHGKSTRDNKELTYELLQKMLKLY
jgi:pimeloyl-ACP methyl ester carboxylesterase